MDRQRICCSFFWQTKKIKRAVHPCSKGAQSTSKFLLSINILGVPRKSIDIYEHQICLSVKKCLHSTKLVKDKRPHIDIAALIEKIHQGDLRKKSAVFWIKTTLSSKSRSKWFVCFGDSSDRTGVARLCIRNGQH